MRNLSKKKQKGKLNNCTNSVLISIFKKKKHYYFLKSSEFGKISINQIKAFKKLIVKKFKKKLALIYFNLNANIPVTKKPTEVRMGKGKGSINSFVQKVKTGTSLCVIKSHSHYYTMSVLKQSQNYLPINTKIYFL